MLFEKIQLDQGETVLKIVRKHWFVIVSKLFVTFIALLLPFFILFLLVVFPGLIASLKIDLQYYTAIIIFLIAAWSLLVILTAFSIWTNYYLDLWIITDRRIIVIDQIGFFHRNVSIFRLERLQDIEFNISGLIPTLLNFGSIRAQTAGSFEENFKTAGLPDPRSLQALIQKAADARLKVIRHQIVNESV